METKTIEARGLACPQPVMMARQAILEGGQAEIAVLVDGAENVENIQRMAKGLGWSAAVEPVADGIRMTLRPAGETAPRPAAASEAARPTQIVVLVASHVVGSGDDELGRILMRAFVKTLGQLQPPPAKIIFLNAGVWLTTEGSELLDDLEQLEQLGVQILSCGTCLDYFRRKESLKVGSVTNMFEIVSSLVEADRVLRP